MEYLKTSFVTKSTDHVKLSLISFSLMRDSSCSIHGMFTMHSTKQDQSKKRRKVLTGKKKEGKTQQPEGSTYTAGQF